jgi:hypothetical protein
MMNELDDRLVGDPVWELFPHPAARLADDASRTRRYERWLMIAGLIVLGWLLCPPLAVVTACLAVAARDFRTGRQLARSIPSKAGGTICARFAYAWGAWKFGAVAFGLTLGTLFILMREKEGHEVRWECVTAMLLVAVGFILSAAWTALGVLEAYRSGMRVWVGEGVNRVRTLLLGMLGVTFFLAVLLPLLIWLSEPPPPDSRGRPDELAGVPTVFCTTFVGELVILILCVRMGQRVIADHPGKFGPKVPTVGKWNS